MSKLQTKIYFLLKFVLQTNENFCKVNKKSIEIELISFSNLIYNFK